MTDPIGARDRARTHARVAARRRLGLWLDDDLEGKMLDMARDGKGTRVQVQTLHGRPRRELWALVPPGRKNPVLACYDLALDCFVTFMHYRPWSQKSDRRELGGTLAWEESDAG